MSEDRGALDLTLLIEQHKKEIWDYKQKESQWIRDKNQLDGNKRIVEELSAQIIELRKKVREAEGETSLVQSVGMNSPEMKAMQKRVKEVEDDNKKLVQEVDDLTRRRKFGAGPY